MNQEIISSVWRKALIVPGNDSDKWRKDECGAWIGWEYYGDRDSQYGWEIDHINPVSNDGHDGISNLRPLQWENNMSKSDGRLVCAVKSSGVDNKRIY